MQWAYLSVFVLKLGKVHDRVMNSWGKRYVSCVFCIMLYVFSSTKWFVLMDLWLCFVVYWCIFSDIKFASDEK